MFFRVASASRRPQAFDDRDGCFAGGRAAAFDGGFALFAFDPVPADFSFLPSGARPDFARVCT